MTSDEISIQVVEILNGRQIPYMLVGSLSTNFHSITRSTKDADIVVQSSLAEAARLIARQLNFLKLDPQYGFESVAATRKLVLRSSIGEGFIVELFGLSDDAHDQARFARRQFIDWDGRPAWIATAEDAVITKLRWSSSIGREKDLVDARNVIAAQYDFLDWPYIENWCDQHGSRPILEKIRNDLRRV
jgi:hypothetical protein